MSKDHRIIPYFSESARDDCRWLAYIEVARPVKAKDALAHDETNDPFGYVCLRFSGRSREEAIGKAQAWWDRQEAARVESIRKAEDAKAKAAATRAAKTEDT